MHYCDKIYYDYVCMIHYYYSYLHIAACLLFSFSSYFYPPLHIPLVVEVGCLFQPKIVCNCICSRFFATSNIMTNVEGEYKILLLHGSL